MIAVTDRIEEPYRELEQQPQLSVLNVAELRDLKVAAVVGRRAVEVNPLHDKAQDYYGQLLARGGRMAEASHAMEQAVTASVSQRALS